MNTQMTYFLQRVVSGIATSIIYASFDQYRYNQRYKHRRRPNRSKSNNYRYQKPKRNNKGFDYVETNYDRNRRYQ